MARFDDACCDPLPLQSICRSKSRRPCPKDQNRLTRLRLGRKYEPEAEREDGTPGQRLSKNARASRVMRFLSSSGRFDHDFTIILVRGFRAKRAA